MKFEIFTALLLFLCLQSVLATSVNFGRGMIPADPSQGSSDTAPASQQHSSVSQAEIDRYYNNIIEGNNLQEIPTEYRDPTPSLAKPNDFDVEEFLKDMDNMECDDKNIEQNGNEKYKKLCSQRLTEDTFSPLGEYNTDHNSFFNYLNNNIYMPLAYNMSRPQSLSNSIVDLVTLNNKNALFEGRPLHTNYNEFQQSIFSLFSRVQGGASNVDQNQELISELMISILKRFHLYWNQLRYKDQVDKIKMDTKDVMRNILKEFQVKEKFLFEVTKTLVDHIKTAYMRFMKAHMSVKLLNKTAPSMISHAIIERYEKMLDVIKFSKFTHIKLVREITYMLDLQEAFYAVNYKMGINEPRSMLEFQTEVMENIQHSYNFYVAQISATDKERLIEIRNFTATLLLKMKHMEYIIFRYHSITEFVNMSKTMIYERDPVMVKLYYEILDNMLTIPKKCVNYLVLKNCALHETNKTLRYIASKYMLKRSNKGWLVFDYTQNVLRHLFSKSNDLVFSNWTIFKSYFYQNLFSVMYNFKKRYYIADEDTVEDLENMIGSTIDGFKEDEATRHIDFGIIDQLDKDLYQKFLDIKANYNKLAPFDKDPQVATSIENDLTVFFVGFKQKYKNAISEDFIRLLEKIKNTVDQWRAEMMSKQELSIQVGTLPISMGPVPQVFHTVVANNQNIGARLGNSPTQVDSNDVEEQPSQQSDGNTGSVANGGERRLRQPTDLMNETNTELPPFIAFRDENSPVIEQLKTAKSTRVVNEQTNALEAGPLKHERLLNDIAIAEPTKIMMSAVPTQLLIDEEKSKENRNDTKAHAKIIADSTKLVDGLKSTKKDMTLKPQVKDVWSLESLLPNHAVTATSEEKDRDQGFENGIYFK